MSTATGTNRNLVLAAMIFARGLQEALPERTAGAGAR
jgi:hypothetical protein